MSYLCFGTFFSLLCGNKKDWDKIRKPIVSNRVLYFALYDIVDRQKNPRLHVERAKSGSMQGYTDDVVSIAKNCKGDHPIQRTGSVENYRKRFKNEHESVVADYQAYIQEYMDELQLGRLAKSIIELINDSQADENSVFYVESTLQECTKRMIVREMRAINLSGLLAGVMYYILNNEVSNNNDEARNTIAKWNELYKKLPHCPDGSSLNREVHVVDGIFPEKTEEMETEIDTDYEKQEDILPGQEKTETTRQIKKVEGRQSVLLIENVNNKKEAYNRKIKAISVFGVDNNNWQYNDNLLKHFVMRRCRYYGTKREYSINKIKRELMSCTRNLILTGKAGVGKSTVLKWLYANTYLQNYKYLYLTARMFANLDTLEDICEQISKYMSDLSPCVVFFDGLDELRCVRGTKGELEKFLNYFEDKSEGISHNSLHRFVIATRPEHFLFHNAVTRPSQKNLDKYGIYEILSLNYQESLKVCLSIKSFSEFDNENNLKHFIDKWPVDGDTHIYALPEREYKRQLKKYLYASNIGEDSLLATPILCRYAYQIVCDWASEGDGLLNNKMLSIQIETAMRCYIKWEFHDEYDMTTQSDEGKRKFDRYIKDVFEFLTDIVSEMIDTEDIERSKWEKLREKRKIGVNAALCILQENENGKLSFVHKSFMDYFLARFYVEKLSHGIKKERLSLLIQQIETNLDFVYLFAELLVKKKSKPLCQICNAIANEKKVKEDEELAELLVDYLLGKTAFYYQENMGFTIEDYLNVFPCGTVLFIGDTFNKKYFDKLKKDRILVTKHPEFMKEARAASISKKFTMRGVKYIADFSNEYQVVCTLFGVYSNHSLNEVGGYFRESLTKEDIVRIIRQLDLEDYFKGSKISLRDIIESPLMNVIRNKKRIENWKKRNYEDQKICNSIYTIVKFSNSDEKYWYLFHEGSLLVCEILEDNYEYFTKYYRQLSTYDLFDFQMLYCHYRLKTEDEEDILEEFTFRSVSEIEMNFNSEVRECFSSKILNSYYHVHWKNVKLFEYSAGELLDISGKGSVHIFTLAELLNIYEEADQILSESPNIKLQLIMSDEKLITYYLLGQGEEMVKLAKATMEDCRELNHLKGEELRLFLMENETSYTGEDRKRVKDYAKNYIWY